MKVHECFFTWNVYRSSFSSDTSSSRPDLQGMASRKSSYSQGPPRVVINGEQQPTAVGRRKSDDEPPATLPRIVEGKRARRSSDGHRPTKNRKTVEVFRWLRQAPKTELEALSKMSQDEIKHCIIQALKDKDPTWLLGDRSPQVDGDDGEAVVTHPTGPANWTISRYLGVKTGDEKKNDKKYRSSFVISIFFCSKIFFSLILITIIYYYTNKTVRRGEMLYLGLGLPQGSNA